MIQSTFIGWLCKLTFKVIYNKYSEKIHDDNMYNALFHTKHKALCSFCSQESPKYY